MASEKTADKFSVPPTPESSSSHDEPIQRTPISSASDVNSKLRRDYVKSFMSPTDALISPCTKQLMGNRRQLNQAGRHKLIHTMIKEEPCKSKLADKANEHRVDKTHSEEESIMSEVSEEKENVSISS